ASPAWPARASKRFHASHGSAPLDFVLAAAVLVAVYVHPSSANTGLVPLNDLGAGLYQGFQGGLYPGGANVPPAAHRTASLAAAGSIVSRNAAGAPDPEGLIVMIAVGMSNTTHEFAV